MTVATAVYRGPMIALTLVWVGACLGGTELVSPPRIPVTSVTLEFRVDSEDAATAAALGWTNGIPGVQVTVTPADTTSGPPRQLQATDSGTLFLDQLAGRYGISVDRWLTDSERAQLLPGDDAVGFIARTSMNTMTASARMRVDLVASRRGTLHFTEWGMLPAENPVLGGYFYGGYVVIANNSDSTIYLDGMLLGTAVSQPFEINGAPCADRIAFYSDPAGVWSAWIYQFPGTASDYPIRPGEHRVIATDAIDHRPIIADG